MSKIYKIETFYISRKPPPAYGLMNFNKEESLFMYYTDIKTEKKIFCISNISGSSDYYVNKIWEKEQIKFLSLNDAKQYVEQELKKEKYVPLPEKLEILI